MLPGLGVFAVIVIVLLCVVVLDRGLFKPLSRVMRQREEAIRSAQEGTAELEQRTRAAQAEVYREMDENRRLANEQRAELMAATRQQVDAEVAEAGARVKAQAEEARLQLEREADTMADQIVERVLGRKAS